MLCLVPLLTLNPIDEVYAYGMMQDTIINICFAATARHIDHPLFYTLATKTLHEYNLQGDETGLEIATQHFLSSISYAHAVPSLQRFFLGYDGGNTQVCVMDSSFPPFRL